MLKELNDIAFRFQIDSDDTIGDAARLSSVISVLNGLYQTYQNFIKIEFIHNSEFAKVLETNKKAFDPVREDMELLITDLKFGSFEAAVAPNLAEGPTLFANTVTDWKRSAFSDFKTTIGYADYNSPTHLQKIRNRYTAEERIRIFQPLLTVVKSNKHYRVNLIGSDGAVTPFREPTSAMTDFYVPKLVQNLPAADDYRTIQLFVRVRPDKNGGFTFSKKTMKEVLFYEELEHEIYPYKPTVIQFEDDTYVLNQRLDCQVSYEDDSYIIGNQQLDVSVWGRTREEAETAFGFAFHSLYTTFALDDDRNLSANARVLKALLLSLVKIKK